MTFQRNDVRWGKDVERIFLGSRQCFQLLSSTLVLFVEKTDGHEEAKVTIRAERLFVMFTLFPFVFLLYSRPQKRKDV